MTLCSSALPAGSLFPVFSFRRLSSVKKAESRRKLKKCGASILVMATAGVSRKELGDDKATKLVTFLGKGGSGKTTAAIFAAQHYAFTGLNTCLLVHSQDFMAEYLLSTKIGPSPVKCHENLSVVRLETTKMILEPLKRLKQADARLNLTQGVIEGVVGEELGILPGMDSIFSAIELERLLGFFGNPDHSKIGKGKFDIIVYDGLSTEETLRMIGGTSKAKLYLKYLRSLAEKTDFGRVAGPSLLRLVDDTLSSSGRRTNLNGKMSSEKWDHLEQALEEGSSVFSEPKTVGCYLVMDPCNHVSLKSALRYWGCAIQAGVQISGAFGLAPPASPPASVEALKSSFSPLPFALMPHLKLGNNLSWNEVMSCNHSKDARDLLSGNASNKSLDSPVKFDLSNKSVKLFMPGFDKSEIKLYQFKGGSELLVEAGDQRRVIRLPTQIQGKVGGATFVDQNLIIAMR